MSRIIGLFIFVLFTLLIVEPPLQFMFPLLSIYIPDIVLLSVLYFAHNLKTPSEGGTATLILGYLMDLLSGSPIGIHSFSYVLVFFAARFFSTLIYGSSILSIIILAGITNILAGLFILLTDKWLNVMHSSFPDFLFILKQAATTALFAPVFLHIMWKLDKFISYEAPQEGVFK